MRVREEEGVLPALTSQSSAAEHKHISRSAGKIADEKKKQKNTVANRA